MKKNDWESSVQEFQKSINNILITVLNGDITELKVDIIVNAANKTLLGGGGVDGAIHRKAGLKLKEACAKLHGCKDGEAKMTDAYNLPCKKIIHTVGPIYSSGSSNEAETLSNCYINSIKMAENYRLENELKEITVAFPCISTGAFSYPKEQASLIAIKAIKETGNQNINIFFVCFDKIDYELYYKNLE